MFKRITIGLFLIVPFTLCCEDTSSRSGAGGSIDDATRLVLAAKDAGIPLILLEDGYTEKNTTEIYHNHLVKDFIDIEKIVSKYL